MERRYHRVEMGAGAFHNPPRARYSEETKNLMKLLMEESKLSMKQRKSVQEAIDRGESLPPSTRRSEVASNKGDSNYEATMPNVWKKRTQDVIINSGAYEREQFRRTAPLPNKEKQKRYLACMMAYGKEMPETPRGPKILHRARREPQLPSDIDPIDEIIQGIRERMEFLDEMNCLGLGKKYYPIIQQEIAEKIRRIEAIDKQRSKDLRREIKGYEYERPAPKPLPLGDLDES